MSAATRNDDGSGLGCYLEPMAKSNRSEGLRADQWLMLGVGAIGLYAVYRLTRPSAAPIKSNGDVLGPGNIPSRVPSLNVNIVDPNGRAVMSAGRNYRGRIELAPSGSFVGPQLPRPPQPLEFAEVGSATRATIASDLQRLGFQNVQVYVNAREAASAIPLPTALEGAGSGSRWFTGTWVGANGSQSMGPRIVLLWPTVS